MAIESGNFRVDSSHSAPASETRIHGRLPSAVYLSRVEIHNLHHLQLQLIGFVTWCHMHLMHRRWSPRTLWDSRFGSRSLAILGTNGSQQSHAVMLSIRLSIYLSIYLCVCACGVCVWVCVWVCVCVFFPTLLFWCKSSHALQLSCMSWPCRRGLNGMSQHALVHKNCEIKGGKIGSNWISWHLSAVSEIRLSGRPGYSQLRLGG